MGSCTRGIRGTMLNADLLTARQVQELLHVDTSTVYRMAGDGRLPAIKVGKQWRFPADEIARMVGASDDADPTTAADPASTIDPDTAEAIVDVMADRLGVMMVVTDLAGRPMTRIANPCDWLVEHDDQPTVIQTCVDEWRRLGADVDLSPRLRRGSLGFECARVFVRHDDRLIGMVLAGGIAPIGDTTPTFYHLDDIARRRLLDTLPMVAALVGRVAVPISDDKGATT